jgi:hypothetical protein
MSDFVDNMIGTIWEPKRVYRWIFSWNGIETYMAKSFARPHRTFQEIEIDYINTKRWYAGKAIWDPLALTLYDPMSPSASLAVNTWLTKNYDEASGYAGCAGVYKAQIELKMLNPVGAILETWILKGAWAKDVDFGNNLDYNSSDPVTIICTIRHDTATYEKHKTNDDTTTRP